MLLALARHIFEHGVEGRFYSDVRKYHHEGGKVYWSMDPTPEATEPDQPLRRIPDLRGATGCQHPSDLVAAWGVRREGQARLLNSVLLRG